MRRQHGRRNQFYGPLGDIPSRREAVGPINDPGAGLIPEWINNWTASNFPFVIGLTSERIIPANPLRSYLLVQNKSAASDLFITFGQTAPTFNGVLLIPRGSYDLIGGAVGRAGRRGAFALLADDPDPGSCCPRVEPSVLATRRR